MDGRQELLESRPVSAEVGRVHLEHPMIRSLERLLRQSRQATGSCIRLASIATQAVAAESAEDAPLAEVLGGSLKVATRAVIQAADVEKSIQIGIPNRQFGEQLSVTLRCEQDLVDQVPVLENVRLFTLKFPDLIELAAREHRVALAHPGIDMPRGRSNRLIQKWFCQRGSGFETRPQVEQIRVGRIRPQLLFVERNQALAARLILVAEAQVKSVDSQGNRAPQQYLPEEVHGPRFLLGGATVVVIGKAIAQLKAAQGKQLLGSLEQRLALQAGVLQHPYSQRLKLEPGACFGATVSQADLPGKVDKLEIHPRVLQIELPEMRVELVL